MRRICLDTSAYLLPCDMIPDNSKHTKMLKDQKAILKIKQLAQEGKIKLFLPANVHSEMRKHRDPEKRRKADQFWEEVKPELIPQEIGFHGLSVAIGRTAEYQATINHEEALLVQLRDRSLDSSIILNSNFFGMTLITSDYKRIEKIRGQLGNSVNVLRPSEFLAIVGW